MAKEWDLDPLGGDIWVDTLEHFEPQISPNSLGLQKHPASSLVNKGNYTSHGNYATQMRQVPYQTVFTSGSVLTTPAGHPLKTRIISQQEGQGGCAREMQDWLRGAGRNQDVCLCIPRVTDQRSGSQRWTKRDLVNIGVLSCNIEDSGRSQNRSFIYATSIVLGKSHGLQQTK